MKKLIIKIIIAAFLLVVLLQIKKNSVKAVAINNCEQGSDLIVDQNCEINANWETKNYNTIIINAGKTLRITGALTLNATGDVTINGEINADGSSPPNCIGDPVSSGIRCNGANGYTGGAGGAKSDYRFTSDPGSIGGTGNYGAGSGGSGSWDDEFSYSNIGGGGGGAGAGGSNGQAAGYGYNGCNQNPGGGQVPGGSAGIYGGGGGYGGCEMNTESMGYTYSGSGGAGGGSTEGRGGDTTVSVMWRHKIQYDTITVEDRWTYTSLGGGVGTKGASPTCTKSGSSVNCSNLNGSDGGHVGGGAGIGGAGGGGDGYGRGSGGGMIKIAAPGKTITIGSTANIHANGGSYGGGGSIDIQGQRINLAGTVSTRGHDTGGGNGGAIRIWASDNSMTNLCSGTILSDGGKTWCNTNSSLAPTLTPTPTLIPTLTPTPTLAPTLTPSPTSTPTPTPTPITTTAQWYKFKDVSFHKIGSDLVDMIPPTVSKYTVNDADDDGSRVLVIGTNGTNGVVQAQGIINTNSAPLVSSPQLQWQKASYTKIVNFDVTKFISYIKSKKEYRTINSLNEINTTGKIYLITGDQTLTNGEVSNAPFILIVQGNITIDQNNKFSPPGNKSVIIVSTGTITFNPQTTEAYGAFIANSINTGTTADQGLKIFGNLITNSITNERKWADNSKPSLFIVFDSTAYLNLLPYLSTINYNWKEIQ